MNKNLKELEKIKDIKYCKLLSKGENPVLFNLLSGLYFSWEGQGYLKNNGISLIVFFSQSYDIRKVKKWIQKLTQLR